VKSAAPFQQRTAEYAFRRMWIDQDNSHRFLIADEVGLGKTVVAREIVRRTLTHLGKAPIDIIYICSSRAIAIQNLRKLKGADAESAFSTRLTLLATRPRDKTETVRFLALTPGTSFELGHRTGWVTERALIWSLLRGWLRPDGLESALQIVTQASWDRELKELRNKPPDRAIAKDFRIAVQRDESLIKRLRDLALEALELERDDFAVANLRVFKRRRNEVVGRLREHLARASVRALSPRGLVILDEFQRFPDLLRNADRGSAISTELAAELLSRKLRYRRVLLLSATPYRMLGLRDPEGEKPHADLVELTRFLSGSHVQADALDSQLTQYARSLQAGVSREPDIISSRNAAQAILHRFMVRTERVARTERGDAMVLENVVPVPAQASDLRSGVAARRLAKKLGSHDTVEYWKSAPYILEFMRAYDLKNRALKRHRAGKRWVEAESRRGGLLLNGKHVRKYLKIDPANPRLRELLRRSLPPGAERLLWIPPSMPYIESSGPFAAVNSDLKALIFSEWQLAPDAISALISYEVERRLVRGLSERRKVPGKKRKTLTFSNYTSLGDKLRLSSPKTSKIGDTQGRGLAPLALLYPSNWLAEAVDPLMLAVAARRQITTLEAQEAAIAALREHLHTLRKIGKRTGRRDDRWYWIAPILLENKEVVGSWLRSTDPFGFAADAEAEREQTTSEEYRLRAAVQGAIDGTLRLGRPPADLARVLATAALAGPGTCALRALRRTLPDGAKQQPELMRAAFRIARGFQSMFNQPEAALAVPFGMPIRAPYWKQVLSYLLAGNLQALLDEQCHMEADGLSLLESNPAKTFDKIAQTIAAAMRLRYARIEIAGLGRRRRKAGNLEEPKGTRFALRGRHAVRFAEIREEDGSVTRLDAVREAFNSPFRPFLLASTSVGQEGLDFHPWCHVVCHWNLPRGPVELEQREGRVHRYKGHAVRLNVAKATGLARLGESNLGRWEDPWTKMFQIAEQVDGGELAPCWVFDRCHGPEHIERLVLLPSLSREAEAWPLLKRRLALYRLVLGQPRQEDLLAALERGDITEEQTRKWRIDLSPPRGQDLEVTAEDTRTEATGIVA
jgi:hypothetical protein